MNLIERLQRDRQELLDLSARNRLISTPLDPTRSKRLDIIDERSEEIFRLLVREKKSLSFLPGRKDAEAAEGDFATQGGLFQPEDDDAPADRHTDLRLQTRLTSERLQSRLLDLCGDARTFIEEQGVSILYLALGFLKWYEAPSSDKARYAPLVLVPVELERPSAASRFRLKSRDEDIATNLSLQAKLQKEFQIALPDIEDSDEFSPQAYFEAVRKAIAIQPRWEVRPDTMVLWFFSFAKYLMYRDLDSESWPEHAPLGTNPLLAMMLQDGFGNDPPLCGEDQQIDELILPADMIHVTDADSSQAIVIEEVRRGRHLVVQGPPGTGKSQTITNIIATAVKDGKKVLFVAEKLAALEVVKSRLDRLGLGSVCLELHSHNANKKQVAEELSRTLNLGRPTGNGFANTVDSLRHVRERLNRHAALMNSPLEPAGRTPFQILGRLVSLSGEEPVDFKLSAPTAWSRRDFEERCSLLEDLVVHVRSVGPPNKNPWRGVALEMPPLRSDLKQWLARIGELHGWLDDLSVTAGNLARTLGVQQQQSLHARAVQTLARLAESFLDAPPMDQRQMSNAAWEERRDAIDELVQSGQTLDACSSRLSGVVADSAWDLDMAPVRHELAAHGQSWLRWLRRPYREAVATLRGVAEGELPKLQAERLRIVDDLLKGRKLITALDDAPANGQLGRDAFGSRWSGSRSNWTELAAIAKWERDCRGCKLPKSFRQIFSRLADVELCREPLGVLTDRLQRVQTSLPEISKDLQIDLSRAFGTTEIDLIPLDQLSSRLRGWQENAESLSKWVAYWIRLLRLRSAGLAPLVDRIHAGAISGDAAVGRFHLAYYEALMRHLFDQHAELATFDGETYEQWIAEFRKLDLERIQLARLEVCVAHFESIPREGGLGEIAIVKREVAKKRSLKPIRVLLREAGNAIQKIKPVFMMSPISIAQFLEPGTIAFDLLLIDEASQVSPVDAFGAIARAKQVVVVGDSKQLPPSRFFTTFLDDESDGDEVDSAADLESILGLCVGQGMLQRMLRWHYRSRHHSLIAISNREFYENNLFVIPSPTAASATGGLQFRPVAGGVFDRGGTATNRVEARAVAQAVVEHARSFSAQSLGVGAFSVAQRDVIRDELELLLRQAPDVHEFFGPGRPEPFFIKNLENIQGDERDVIFISVGYARDSSGFMAMNFGPLSSEGGERRLNVLISRARDQCTVFSSITADDIDLERGRSRGVAAFKNFLRFAQTGILDDRLPTGREYDSEFERQVANAISGHGYQVDCQVGSSGFVIDLAVVDPKLPGRYLLGIECDGATYHSSRAARDRDRLREQVLRDRAWRIHRIWSTDWFHRPNEQLRKVLAAIEIAESEMTSPPRSDATAGAEPTATEIIERSENGRTSGNESDGVVPPWVVPYSEASVDVPRHTAIHQFAPRQLLNILSQIVAAESPVHREEVARRVTALWGLERTGSRIVQAVESALAEGIRAKQFRDEAGFLALSSQAEPPVRNRQAAESSSLRKPEMLPPSEIRAAVRRLVTENVGASRDEVRTTVARCLGFRSTSTQLKEVIDRQIDAMLNDGMSERDGKLFVGELI